MPLVNNDALEEVSFYEREKHLYPSLRNPGQPLGLANEPGHLKEQFRRRRHGRALGITGLSFL